LGGERRVKAAGVLKVVLAGMKLLSSNYFEVHRL
jgi:hypothetical protein